MAGSVQQKEGDKERPMPWPSFICYWLTAISLKPWQTPQGITLKLVIEDMYKVLGYPVSRYALPICSDDFESCFQCLFFGCLKMVVQCSALLPSINPDVCPHWHPPDRATHQAMIPSIQSVAALHNVSGKFSQLHNTHFRWEITWPPPHGFCAILSLWEAYFSGLQLRQMYFEKFGFMRKNYVAEFWAQPACSNWKSAFQLCWKLQAGTLCHCIQWIAKKHYMILPCIGKNPYSKQYGTYLSTLPTTYVTLVAYLKSTNCVVQFFMTWDLAIMECFMRIPYYPGNTIGVFPSVCRETVVQQYMNFNHLYSLATYTTDHSTYVWLSFPWNPGLHTWLWCCCRSLQQSSCGPIVADHHRLNWWRELAIPRVFSEASYQREFSRYQCLHWGIRQQVADLALPWNPGGNSTSAWGQAEFQAGEYVMYRVYAIYWAKPGLPKRRESSLKPNRPSPTQSWLCLVHRETGLCIVELTE
jgi:hypothetical protein